MKCPCKGCICVPVCKDRDFIELAYHCSLVKEYFGQKEKMLDLGDSCIIEIPCLGHKFRVSKSIRGCLSWNVDRNSSFYTRKVLEKSM